MEGSGPRLWRFLIGNVQSRESGRDPTPPQPTQPSWAPVSQVIHAKCRKWCKVVQVRLKRCRKVRNCRKCAKKVLRVSPELMEGPLRRQHWHHQGLHYWSRFGAQFLPTAWMAIRKKVSCLIDSSKPLAILLCCMPQTMENQPWNNDSTAKARTNGAQERLAIAYVWVPDSQESPTAVPSQMYLDFKKGMCHPYPRDLTLSYQIGIKTVPMLHKSNRRAVEISEGAA